MYKFEDLYLRLLADGNSAEGMIFWMSNIHPTGDHYAVWHDCQFEPLF